MIAVFIIYVIPIMKFLLLCYIALEVRDIMIKLKKRESSCEEAMKGEK